MDNNCQWIADLGNGTYRNPVLSADYSDPDAIRVGDDFFLISSSFAFVPGVPVLHSKDLVNWEIINHVVKKLPAPLYDKPVHGCGTWAPSLRFHDGVYYAFIPLPDEGIFVSKATDPRGEWSELHCIREAKGWIDPCPLWDDDGKAYMAFAYAASRCGINNRIDICPMAPDAGSLLGEPVRVVDGELDHPVVEGPKLYKRNGWYYIFAPAGSVQTGWQTVFRSRNIFGPYEDKIVLHQGSTDINGPHQGAWVELENGENWFLHFQDTYAWGRVLHLEPMKWKNDWPFMGVDQNGDEIGEPVKTFRKPKVGRTYPVKTPATSDEFEGLKLGLQWQWSANPKPSYYGLGEGRLRLFAVNTGCKGVLWNAPNLLTQLLQNREVEADVCLCAAGLKSGGKAGLALMGFTYGYAALTPKGDGFALTVAKGEVAGGVRTGEAKETVVKTIPISGDSILLRVTLRADGHYGFWYSADGEIFSDCGVDFILRQGAWTGAKLSLFAVGDDKGFGGSADFDYIRFNSYPLGTSCLPLGQS